MANSTDPIFTPLYEAYERGKVQVKEQSDQYVANLQRFAEEHPDLAPIARRLLSQHMGWT